MTSTAVRLGQLKLTDEGHETKHLPDAFARRRDGGGSQIERAATELSFCVAQADIAANGCHLSINHYKEIGYGEAAHSSPAETTTEPAVLEDETAADLDDLRVPLA